MSKDKEDTTKSPGDIHTEYGELKKKAEEQHPGINELLEVYGKYQAGMQQNEEYLQLYKRTVVSSTSDTSTTNPR